MKYTKISLLFACAALMLASSCNKKSKNEQVDNNAITKTKSNVVVVDTAQYNLVSTQQELNDGIYIYNICNSLADIKHNGNFIPGNVIVGTTGEGYLRKITGITSGTNTITVHTVAGKLEDVFEQANFSFFTGFSDALSQPFSYNFDNIKVLNSNNNVINITSGNVAASGLWRYNYSFKNGQLATCNIANESVAEISASANYQVIENAAGHYQQYDTLQQKTTRQIVMVGDVPLVVMSKLYVINNTEANLNTGIARQLSYTTNCKFNLGTLYSNGTWKNDISFNPTTTASASLLSGSTDMDMTAYIITRLNVSISGLSGTYISLPVKAYMQASKSSTTSDWMFMGGALLRPTFDAGTEATSYNAPANNFYKETDSTNVYTPYALQKVSGDNQTGTGGQYLANPVKVRVVNSQGIGQPNVPVYFKVLSGGGNLTYTSIFTDNGGYATATWALGMAAGQQSMEAVAYVPGNKKLGGAPIVFTAN